MKMKKKTLIQIAAIMTLIQFTAAYTIYSENIQNIGSITGTGDFNTTGRLCDGTQCLDSLDIPGQPNIDWANITTGTNPLASDVSNLWNNATAQQAAIAALNATALANMGTYLNYTSSCAAGEVYEWGTGCITTPTGGSGSENATNLISDNPILIKPSGDTDDYISFETPSNLPHQHFVGGSGFLYSDSGQISIRNSSQSTQINMRVDGCDQDVSAECVIQPWIDNVMDLGSATKAYQDIFYEGSLTDTSPSNLEYELETKNKKALDYLVKRDGYRLNLSKTPDSVYTEYDDGTQANDVGENTILIGLQIGEIVEELCLKINGKALKQGGEIDLSFCEGNKPKLTLDEKIKKHKPEIIDETTFTTTTSTTLSPTTTTLITIEKGGEEGLDGLSSGTTA